MPTLSYEVKIRTTSSSLAPDDIDFKDSEIDYTRLGKEIEVYSGDSSISRYGYSDPPEMVDGVSTNDAPLFLKRNYKVEARNGIRLLPQYKDGQWRSDIYIKDKGVHARIYERNGNSEFVSIEFTTDRSDKFKYGGKIIRAMHPPHTDEEEVHDHDHGGSLADETDTDFGDAIIYTKLPIDSSDPSSGKSSVSTEEYDDFSLSIDAAISKYGSINALKAASEKIDISSNKSGGINHILLKYFPIYSSVLIYNEDGGQIFPDTVDQISGSISLDIQAIDGDTIYILYGIIPAIVIDGKAPDIRDYIKYTSGINLLEIRSENIHRFSSVPSERFTISPHQERLSVKVQLSQSIDSFSIETPVAISINGDNLKPGDKIFLKNDGLNFIDIYAPHDFGEMMEELIEDGDKYSIPKYKDGIFAIIGEFDSGMHPIILSKKTGASPTRIAIDKGQYVKLQSVVAKEDISIYSGSKKISDKDWEYISPGIVFVKDKKEFKNLELEYSPLLDLTNTTVYVRDGKFNKSTLENLSRLSEQPKRLLAISSKSFSLPIVGYNKDNYVYMNETIKIDFIVSKSFMKEMVEKWET